MTTSATDAEAIARIIDPDVFCYHKSMIEAGLKDGLSADEARAQADRYTAHTIPPAVVKAERILSYLASRREAQEPEYIYDDKRFNKGVQHVVDMLARNLGVTDWVAGDGSEDYDDDLWQTILNILAAKGLYDPDSGEFASRREVESLDGFMESLHLNERTADLVKRFAVALATKLRLAEEKYDYYDGWARDNWEAECRDHLYQHLDKGDPRDVAAYCAFMWHHGWTTSRREAQEPVAWLRDLDGSGSLHPASEGDPGAFAVYRAASSAPAPAGEVERLRGALNVAHGKLCKIAGTNCWTHNNLQGWQETPCALREYAEMAAEEIDSALNGGLE